jgi:hypothetical protein
MLEQKIVGMMQTGAWTGFIFAMARGKISEGKELENN